jgi:hypothetical protein
VAFDVRIFSARCFGVSDSGDADFVIAAGTNPAPQEAQATARRARHSPQNFVPRVLLLAVDL